MPRLVVFGCSLTYGQGLPDCVDIHDVNVAGPVPSKLGWAAMVANDLNLEVVNNGSPGASNLEILYQLLQFDFQESDTVVIMWTFPFRDTLFYKKLFGGYAIRQLKRWLNPVGQFLWAPTGTEVDFAIKTWIYMHHADLYLKTKNVKYLHYPALSKELVAHMPEYINISNLNMKGFVRIDKALDNHPGLESNKQTAEIIYRILNEQI